MVVIDPNVVFASLDNFFGGFGRGIEGYPPADVYANRDTHYQYYVGSDLCSIHEAWSPIMEINCEHVAQKSIQPSSRLLTKTIW